MAKAIVGDDVYGEDPTVNALQEQAAALVGKEAALFIPSGTMGNLLAVLVHTDRGDEVIVDSQAHICYYEVGAPSMWAGVSLKTVEGLIGPRADELLISTLRPENIHFPSTRLICLENTFNRGGGTVMLPSEMERVYHFARGKNIKVHLDGARIFNAAVATNQDVRDFTANCDSVMFCLSKGLGAPVGSILAGKRDFISRALKYRKALGGGMRQAGVLAAAGQVALQNIDRLQEDHQNAHILAEGMSKLPGISVDLKQVQTNMVQLHVQNPSTTAEIVTRFKDKGILCSAVGPSLIRLVTHLNIKLEDVHVTISAAKEILMEEF